MAFDKPEQRPILKQFRGSIKNFHSLFTHIPQLLTFCHICLLPSSCSGMIYCHPKFSSAYLLQTRTHSFIIPPVFPVRKSALAQHYAIYRPQSNYASHPNNASFPFLVQDPSQYHGLPMVGVFSVWSSIISLTLILMCLIVLNSIRSLILQDDPSPKTVHITS